MSAIKIEKGVPLPPSRRGWSSDAKYPLAEMDVGDSIWLPLRQSSASARAISRGKKLGFKFTTRGEGDGTRVWRIK